MSESRLAALDEISDVMAPVMRLVAGLLRSMAPMVNCVILLNALVGVHEVNAIEFVQITVRMKMSGSEKSARCHGTAKNECVSQMASTLTARANQ